MAKGKNPRKEKKKPKSKKDKKSKSKKRSQRKSIPELHFRQKLKNNHIIRTIDKFLDLMWNSLTKLQLRKFNKI